jgi:hypothetical protein
LEKRFEEQVKTLERRNSMDVTFFMTEKRQLKKELEALKVSVPYMHLTLQHYHIS